MTSPILPYILGIDPGLTGGVSGIDSRSGELLFCHPLPIQIFQLSTQKKTISARTLFEILKPYQHKTTAVLIEEVSAAPNQGVVSMFNFGMGYGMVLGVLSSLDFRIVKVRPSIWKSALNLSSDKKRSLTAAAKLWPSYKHIWSVNKNDGLAESALIAFYGRSILFDSLEKIEDLL